MFQNNTILNILPQLLRRNLHHTLNSQKTPIYRLGRRAISCIWRLLWVFWRKFTVLSEHRNARTDFLWACLLAGCVFFQMNPNTHQKRNTDHRTCCFIIWAVNDICTVLVKCHEGTIGNIEYTLWGWNTTAAILQRTFSKAFSGQTITSIINTSIMVQVSFEFIFVIELTVNPH